MVVIITIIIVITITTALTLHDLVLYGLCTPTHTAIESIRTHLVTSGALSGCLVEVLIESSDQTNIALLKFG